MHERGRTLLEMVFTVLILMSLLALGLPGLRAYSGQAELLGAAEIFKQQCRLARSVATSTGRQTAIRFEQGADGPYISVYRDGNNNGVLAADIQRGTDVRISGPHRLTTPAASVRIAILPGTPA